MIRGDVVVVDFPFLDAGQGSKIRPALVVQSDIYNKKLQTTIVAMITGSTRHAHEPANLLIDPGTPAGQSSGLHGVSVVKGTHLVALSQKNILQTIGSLSGKLMQQMDACLKAAFALP